MDEDLKKIKQLINSKNNQNLYMGFYMLKNYKEWLNGEFIDAFMRVFIKGLEHNEKHRKTLTLNTENKIQILFHEYSAKKKGKVFLCRITVDRKTIFCKKCIQIRHLHDIKKDSILKVSNYLDGFLETI